jgi:molybdopterin converting factor small subunit
VGALVEYLSEKHGHRFREAVYGPNAGRVRSEISIMLNGERCKLERVLADGDEVALLIPLAGG